MCIWKHAFRPILAVVERYLSRFVLLYGIRQIQSSFGDFSTVEGIDFFMEADEATLASIGRSNGIIVPRFIHAD